MYAPQKRLCCTVLWFLPGLAPRRHIGSIRATGRSRPPFFCGSAANRMGFGWGRGGGGFGWRSAGRLGLGSRKPSRTSFDPAEMPERSVCSASVVWHGRLARGDGARISRGFRTAEAAVARGAGPTSGLSATSQRRSACRYSPFPPIRVPHSGQRSWLTRRSYPQMGHWPRAWRPRMRRRMR